MKKSTFSISVTKDRKLVEKAQELRQAVFFDKEGRDEDKFDNHCQHIVVIDEEKGTVIGTYRLLLGSAARKGQGFYSETEFDLTKIKSNCRGEVLEMGRACVEKSYRAKGIINLMWQQILEFVLQNDVKYIFGCASVYHPSPEKVGKIYAFFKENCFSPSELRVHPLKGKEYPYQKSSSYERKKITALLPSLIKGYLKTGALVAGEPVWDREFDTADFFMLADTGNPAFEEMKKRITR